MSIALDTIQGMIDSTAHRATEMAKMYPTGWGAVGAEMGVGIRLKILDEVKREVMRAEAKALEEKGSADRIKASRNTALRVLRGDWLISAEYADDDETMAAIHRIIKVFG